MPRGRTHYAASNLSLTIPRRVHRMARTRFLATGASSFASYIAWALTSLPESLTPSQQVEIMAIELELKAFQQERTS